MYIETPQEENVSNNDYKSITTTKYKLQQLQLQAVQIMKNWTFYILALDCVIRI